MKRGKDSFYAKYILFGVSFTNGIAELPQPYLRKEIIKKAKEKQNND